MCGGLGGCGRAQRTRTGASGAGHVNGCPGGGLLESAGRQSLEVLQRTEGSHGELGVAGGEQVKDARLEVDVLHLQRLAALSGGALHAVGLLGRRRQALGRTLLLAVQRVLLDEFAARAAVQAQLQAPALLGRLQGVLGHADGEGQVAAHATHDDGRADVARLQPDLAAAGTAAVLRDPQAARLAASGTASAATTTCPIQEG